MKARFLKWTLLLLGSSVGCSLSHNPDLPSVAGDGDIFGDGDGDFGDGDGGDGDGDGDGDAGDGDIVIGGGGARPEEPTTASAGSMPGGAAGAGTEEN